MIAKSLGVIALFAAAALPVAAAAQSAPPPAAQGHRFEGREAMAGRFQEREARRLKALHDVLQIRPDQETAFQTFATAVKPQPPESAQSPSTLQDMASLTTPERLDRMAKMMEAREARRRARFDRVSGAVRTLYAALSPEQKRAFDALPVLDRGSFGLGGYKDRDGRDGRGMAGGWGRRAGGGAPMNPPSQE